jgi:hypothetical protein
MRGGAAMLIGDKERFAGGDALSPRPSILPLFPPSPASTSSSRMKAGERAEPGTLSKPRAASRCARSRLITIVRRNKS